MKTCQPRTYVTGGTSIEILTFIMEEEELYEDFLQTLKSKYPSSEIRIPGARTAEIVFIKKVELLPPRKTDLDYWKEEVDEPLVKVKKKKR